MRDLTIAVSGVAVGISLAYLYRIAFGGRAIDDEPQSTSVATAVQRVESLVSSVGQKGGASAAELVAARAQVVALQQRAEHAEGCRPGAESLVPY